jgi:hypothetical protein
LPFDLFRDPFLFFAFCPSAAASIIIIIIINIIITGSSLSSSGLGLLYHSGLLPEIFPFQLEDCRTSFPGLLRARLPTFPASTFHLLSSSSSAFFFSLPAPDRGLFHPHHHQQIFVARSSFISDTHYQRLTCGFLDCGIRIER